MPAVFGLAGVAVGGALTYATGWKLRKRDYDLRMWDRLADRRIAAHEGVLRIALEMRVMNALGGIDPQGELLRTPAVIASREAFEDWFAQTTTALATGSPWLSIEATREANYLQDYILTLHENTRSMPSNRFPELGLILRQDFVDLSSSLERATHSFFRSDIRSLTLRDPGLWHKYPIEQTEERLRSTRFTLEWEKIDELLRKTGSSAELN